MPVLAAHSPPAIGPLPITSPELLEELELLLELEELEELELELELLELELELELLLVDEELLLEDELVLEDDELVLEEELDVPPQPASNKPKNKQASVGNGCVLKRKFKRKCMEGSLCRAVMVLNCAGKDVDRICFRQASEQWYATRNAKFRPPSVFASR